MPWIGKIVDVQRHTASGWHTVAEVPTDTSGHVTLTLTSHDQVTLRLVDAATSTTAGQATGASTR